MRIRYTHSGTIAHRILHFFGKTMEIIALADIHGSVRCLSHVADRLAAADLILIAGDLTNFGNLAQAELVIGQLREYNKNILAVCGNCDLPETGSYLSEKGFSINCNCVEFDGINFVGLSGSIASGQKSFGKTLEEHFENSLALIEEQTANVNPLVLVTHHPACGTALDTRGDGSAAICGFIERCQPILAVSGHVHESPCKDTLGQCVLVNPGPFHEGSYATIEIEEGAVVKVQMHTV